MMGLTEDENDNEKQLLQNKIDYVKTHGLKIYGLAVLESKEKLLKLIKDKNICSIAINSGIKNLIKKLFYFALIIAVNK